MREAVSVSECKHPRYTHRVRFPGPGGKRKDRFFTNETDALDFAKKQRKETGETGSAFGSIGEKERAALAFWRAFAESASPKPPELLTVLKDFKAGWLASKASVSVTEAVATFLAHQKAEGSGERHLASLKSRLGRLEAEMGASMVSSITQSVFTDWLNGLRATRADKVGEALTLTTRANLCRSLRTFFSFAVARGWTLGNPVPAEKRAKSKAAKLAKHKVPETLPPAEIARFMGAVHAVAPELVPFWALKFFAGIRDAEAGRMTWDMIDLKAGEMHLPARITKTGERRTVKIEPNLAAWLELRPEANRSGSVAPASMARRYWYKRVIKSLERPLPKGKVQSFHFPSNAARHSFGTYHLYAFRNAGETALQLGHKGNPAMLHEHYKNPAAEKLALEFWGIVPAKAGGNVISIKKGRVA